MPKLLLDTIIHNNVDPSEANWYWEVIFEWPGEFGPVTDSSYGYVRDEVTPESRKRDFELAYPEATVLEVNVTMTPNNPDYVAIRKMFNDLD